MENMKKKEKAQKLISIIQRNYPIYPSTFRGCSEKGCKKSGRGSGLCADCATEKLSKMIGKELATRIHESAKTYARILSEIEDIINKN